MRYEYAETWLDIYEDNSNIEMLAAVSTDKKLQARALLWKAIDGKTYADRIYATSAVVRDMMQDEIARRGYKVIDANTHITVDLDKANYVYYPYADHMQYLSIHPPMLSSKPGKEYNIQLNQGEGCHAVLCEACNATGKVECAGKCNGQVAAECEDCGGSNKVVCETCDGKGHIVVCPD